MSRHTKTIINSEGTLLELAWGFDHALGYWYDVFQPDRGTEEYEQLIEGWSSYLGFTHLPKKPAFRSRSIMLEFLIKYDLPEEHQSMVGLDYPF
jgi:hypothetical protein